MNAIPIILLSVGVIALALGIALRGKMRLAAVLVALASGATSVIAIEKANSGKTLDPAMAGSWKGEGDIIVSWCKQKKLALALKIAADGAVTGKVGDATLVDGKLKRNRGAIGRKLNIKTDYIITGKLKGAIVKSEAITRSSADIPLNFDGKELAGGLHTSGKKTGGKKAMKLSAANIVLKREKKKP